MSAESAWEMMLKPGGNGGRRLREAGLERGWERSSVGDSQYERLCGTVWTLNLEFKREATWRCKLGAPTHRQNLKPCACSFFISYK